MTRPLHEDTDVQRGNADATEASEEAKRLGYEPADAPPRGVALGMVGLAMLLVVALFACAGLLRLLGRDEPAPRAVTWGVSPSPGLEKRLIHTEAPPSGNQLPPPAVRRGMRKLEAQGWGETAPAPLPQDAARDHVMTPQ